MIRKRRNAKPDLESTAHAEVQDRLVEKAIDVMGSPEAANQWLSTPNLALDGATPLELAGRPMGKLVVMDVLNSIHHGMFVS